MEVTMVLAVLWSRYDMVECSKVGGYVSSTI